MSQSLAFLEEQIIIASGKVHRIIPLVFHPEMLVYRFLERLCLIFKDNRCLIITEDTAHLGGRGQCHIMYHIGTQTLGLINFSRLHPKRITVLPPVDE